MDTPLDPATVAPLAIERIGDHPALDLVNTVVQINGRLIDTWQTARDVLSWLERSDQAMAVAVTGDAPPALLEAARELRELVRESVLRRKEGKKIDAAALNALLAHASRHLELTPRDDGGLALSARYASGTARQLLAPLAEAAARLLTEADFSLIRRCENPQCVLWFLDRTKSHRRRWCSMAGCGNRHKVASFRQRQARTPSA